MLTDPDAAVRVTAGSALWETTDGVFVGPLTGLMRADSSPQWREAAADQGRRACLLRQASALPGLRRQALAADPGHPKLDFIHLPKGRR